MRHQGGIGVQSETISIFWKYTPVYQPDRRSILHNLKYLSPGYSSDQPTTTLTDGVPLHPDDRSSTSLPNSPRSFPELPMKEPTTSPQPMTSPAWRLQCSHVILNQKPHPFNVAITFYLSQKIPKNGKLWMTSYCIRNQSLPYSYAM